MFNESLPYLHILEIVKIKRNNQKITGNGRNLIVLSCRIQGESLFSYNDNTQVVKRGTILYIPPLAKYSHQCRNEEIIVFHLNIEGLIPNEIRIINTDNPDLVCNMFLTAYNNWQTKSDNSLYYCMAELYKILGYSNILSVEQPQIISPALEYINSHMYDNNLSLDEACKKSAISRIYFNKLFKQKFNTSPIKYINKFRINKAKILLKSNMYTNEEIAYQCGFNDVKYFYTVFKNVTGTTTRKYLHKI